MKPRLRLLQSTLTVLALLSVAIPARAQAADPFLQLRQYDGQDRTFVEQILRQVRAAGTDAARLADIETRLAGVLSDPSATFAGKQEACRILWIVGANRSVPALKSLLADPRLADSARYALERSPAPSAGAALRAALASLKGALLIGVINSVGNRADAAAIPALKRIASGRDRAAASAAVTALGKIGGRAALAALRGLPKSPEVYQATLRAAEKMASGKERSEALLVLGSLAGNGTPPVVRVAALRALASYGAPRTAAIGLVAALSPDVDLQRAAGRVLGSLSSPAATKQVIGAWSSLPPSAQVATLTAWADRKEPLARPVLVKSLSAADPEVRRAAIEAAARLGNGETVAALAEMAVRGEEARLARETLARMGGRDVEQTLLRIARDGKPEVRAALMGVLAERPTPDSLGVLAATAREADPAVAPAALRALSRVGGPDVLPDLVRLLAASENEAIRDSAREAVAAIAQRTGSREGASESLLAALPSASGESRAAVLAALAEVGGDRALEALVQAANSTDAAVRSAAVTALANAWTDARPLPTLLSIARTDMDRNLRVQALRGYLRLVSVDESAPAEQRVGLVREAIAAAARPEEKRQALAILRTLRTPGSIELAAGLLEDEAIAPEAADTVLYLAAEQRVNDRSLPAVRGAQTAAALDRVIRLIKDESIQTRAREIRQRQQSGFGVTQGARMSSL